MSNKTNATRIKYTTIVAVLLAAYLLAHLLTSPGDTCNSLACFR